MITFETLNELTLKVTVKGSAQFFTKQGAFISGECVGPTNFSFDKVLLGPEGNTFQALGRQLMRRVTGENLPLVKVMANGDSVTYYANLAQHVLVYKLGMGEMISVESENLLAFTPDCEYNVRFLAQGMISQKGLCTTSLKGKGPDAYVAILVDGNPIVLSNVQSGTTITTDPDATVCWIGDNRSDPEIKMNMSWKNFIGQSSGESYTFEWGQYKPVTVIIQPNERNSGVSLSMDGGSSGGRPTQQNWSIG